MNKNNITYSIFQKANSIFLILTLIWLTGSTPFIISAQQELAKQQKMLTVDLPTSDSAEDGADVDNNNSNNIEEKVPSTGFNFSEEFLHEHHSVNTFISTTTRNYRIINSGTYIAFHGELHAPPPNMA